MNKANHTTNEKAASLAFSKQAPRFDSLFAGDPIIRYKRERVRDHFMQFIQPGARILELNAGTGDDAIYFAQKGCRVHATDISPAMQAQLAEKVIRNDLGGSITHELCSFTQLDKLRTKGPFDAIFSNFAGLNCTDELPRVLASLDALLKPGGFATLVMLPKFCLWEFLLLFIGKFRTATRRFSGSKGTRAHIEGAYFRCWYYNPGLVKRELRSRFVQRGLEGLCTFVPPSYLTGFAGKHRVVYHWLKKLEGKFKKRWPWRSIGDYYIITLQKKVTPGGTVQAK
jgi:ubiquinone/menaquinone biosynthesis C-methylase UbiE